MNPVPDGTVTIDGVSYQLSELNGTARRVLRSLEAVDSHLRELKQQMEFASVARKVYLRTLQENLPQRPTSAETDKLN